MRQLSNRTNPVDKATVLKLLNGMTMLNATLGQLNTTFFDGMFLESATGDPGFPHILSVKASHFPSIYRYFSGNDLGFTDLMIWPWFDRLEPALGKIEIAQIIKQEYSKAEYSYGYGNLLRWKDSMREQKVVKTTSYSRELYSKYYESNHNCDEGLCACQQDLRVTWNSIQ